MRDARSEPTPQPATSASRGLHALGDPTRSAIARLLLDEPAHESTVGRLATALSLRQPTVSHHLKVLADAEILDREPRGREVWYSLPDRVAALLEEWLEPTSPADMSGALLSKIIDDLSVRFTGTFSRETVERVVLDSYDLLRRRDGNSRTLASSTAQFAAERLSARDVDHDDARSSARPIEVLFVCVQNAGRSQLASAIMRHIGGDRVRVRTAGSAPIDQIRPAVVAALDEIGVPLGGEFPKPLTDDVVQAADVVVTMGCGDACPVFPGRRYLDWSVDDPAGQPIDVVRRIRDDIDERVRGLLAEFGN